MRLAERDGVTPSGESPGAGDPRGRGRIRLLTAVSDVAEATLCWARTESWGSSRRARADRSSVRARPGASCRRRARSCDRDPVATSSSSARLRTTGLDSWRLGGELWGWSDERRARVAAATSGANLVPVETTPEARRGVRRPVPPAWSALLVDRRSGRRGRAPVAAARPLVGAGARRPRRTSRCSRWTTDSPFARRPARPPGPRGRGRPAAAGVHRDVHRGGRRLAARRRGRRGLPRPDRRARPPRSGLRPHRRRPGRLQGRDRRRERRRSARCRACGSRRSSAARASARPAWPPSSRSRGCTTRPVVSLYVNDFNTVARARSTSGSASAPHGEFATVLF